MSKKQGLMRRITGAMMAPVVRTMMRRSVHRMLTMLGMTDEQEYSCDDAYRVLDLYADLTARGEDPAVLMPLVKRHLELCSNCREEFEALLAAIDAT